MATDGKHYWLTPPEVWASLEQEFGKLFDPCPYPRPEGWDGLNMEWGSPAYCNPPFYSVDTWTPDGKKKGMLAWARKAVIEWKKGSTVMVIGPFNGSWAEPLVENHCEVRLMGNRGLGRKAFRWLAIEDGSQSQGCGYPIVLFVLRGDKDGNDGKR